MKKIKLLLLSLAIPFFANASGCYIECQNCKDRIYVEIESFYLNEDYSKFEKEQGWGMTWTCPKRLCAYENLMDARFCAICGTKKPKRNE